MLNYFWSNSLKFPTAASILKRAIFAVLLILTGIIVENRLKLMQGIVALENRYFHQEAYDFVIKLLPMSSSINVMGIKGQILYSYLDYKAELLIPKGYSIKNKAPQQGIVEKEGYYNYSLREFKKRYRDLCSYDGLMITSESPEISKQPIIVNVISGSDIKYSSAIYSIETKNKVIYLTKLEEEKNKKQTKNRCGKGFF